MSNINKHHQKTIDSYFHHVIYDEDIIMGLYVYKFLNSISCDVVSIFLKQKCSFILTYLHCVY